LAAILSQQTRGLYLLFVLAVSCSCHPTPFETLSSRHWAIKLNPNVSFVARSFLYLTLIVSLKVIYSFNMIYLESLASFKSRKINRLCQACCHGSISPNTREERWLYHLNQELTKLVAGLSVLHFHASNFPFLWLNQHIFGLQNDYPNLFWRQDRWCRWISVSHLLQFDLFLLFRTGVKDFSCFRTWTVKIVEMINRIYGDLVFEFWILHLIWNFH
jgi:hypothetical protein